MARQFTCKNCETRHDTEKVVIGGINRYCSKSCRLEHTRAKTRKEKEKVKIRKTKAKEKKANSASKLIKIADTLFSKYIRYRDSLKTTGTLERCKCITCNKEYETKLIHNGHFASRRFYQSRWLDKNCNAQCYMCNVGLGGEQYKHGQKIDEMYGEGTAEQIMKIANTMEKLDKEEIKQTIENIKIKLKQFE